MSKRTLRIAFIVGVIVCSGAFLALTADTLSKVPARTNAQNLTYQVVKGKQAWQKYDCIDCHTILGNGAYYGPDLTKVTKTRGESFVRAWLKNPGGEMPNQGLTDQEVEDLTAFLSWVSEIDTNNWPPEPLAKAAPPAAAGGELVARGSALFESKGCVACHGPQAEGTDTAPTLIGVGTKYDQEYLARWLRDPASIKPDTAMPNLGLTDAEVEALIAYLQTLE